jgi:hypothetical protein
MLAIESELRRTGLWEVYQRDVLDLEPVLVHMQQRGMPIDSNIRLDRANKLSELRNETLNQLESRFPLETRKVAHVYINPPKDLLGLLSRPSSREVPVCSLCGAVKPRKDHFKRFVKKHNPCADGQVERRSVPVEEYYRLADFTPSRDQLIRYHNHLGRQLPTVYDRKERKRKVSFGESEVKKLILTFPDDPVYNLLLDYRSLDKIAGTYIGRPVDS